MRWVIGVDEAGRGPLAGPIAVGAVAIRMERNEWKYWNGLKDSKQLSEKAREEWLVRIKRTPDREIRYACSMASARIIDREGIVRAAKQATARAIKRLGLSPKDTAVLLDRGLSAPDAWEQEQYTKGDERIPVIALASVVAKVTRDRVMVRLGKKHPEYGFEVHKGYGTAAHQKAIRTHGPILGVHRTLFIRGVMNRKS